MDIIPVPGSPLNPAVTLGAGTDQAISLGGGSTVNWTVIDGIGSTSLYALCVSAGALAVTGFGNLGPWVQSNVLNLSAAGPVTVDATTADSAMETVNTSNGHIEIGGVMTEAQQRALANPLIAAWVSGGYTRQPYYAMSWTAGISLAGGSAWAYPPPAALDLSAATDPGSGLPAASQPCVGGLWHNVNFDAEPLWSDGTWSLLYQANTAGGGDDATCGWWLTQLVGPLNIGNIPVDGYALLGGSVNAPDGIYAGQGAYAATVPAVNQITVSGCNGYDGTDISGNYLYPAWYFSAMQSAGLGSLYLG